MPQKKLPLIGRLAVQLKLITPDQLAQAISEKGHGAEKRFGEVLQGLGLIDATQLQKLESIQRGLIAKHRAKQAASAGGAQAERPHPTAAAQGTASARAERIHDSAARAAEEAAPVTGETVQKLAEPPAPTAPRPLPSATAEQPREIRQSPGPKGTASPESASQSASNPSEGESESLGLALPEPDADTISQLHQILGKAIEANASDVHIHSGGSLKLRIDGELAEHGSTSLDRDLAERLVAASLTPEERAELCRAGEIDFCLEIEGIGRFRANAYRQQRGFDVVYRSIPAVPPTLEDLGLPSELARLTDFHQGMVLLTGPAGCGKTATLAAMINLINEQREEHILTVEDPIEVIHPPKGCLVNQRHAGNHTDSFARALRGALREDPDIIAIGELRDLETISLAMTAAETGHFVLATLHTNNAVRTINRMIGAYPSNEQAQVRTMLSESLRAVVSQRLVPRADGTGRVPALEVLVINKAIGNLIRDEKTVQIRSAIQTGRAHGMYLLEQSLNELVGSGQITRETALRFAEEKKMITAGA